MIQGVHAIIFISALSEFDQLLEEDSKTNRMVESMRLFAFICNSRWFIKTAMILFLNKMDIFAEKIRHTSIRTALPGYTGGCTYHEQALFIEEKFVGLARSQKDTPNVCSDKSIFVHQTCATDTKQVQVIISATVDLTLQTHLRGMGLY